METIQARLKRHTAALTVLLFVVMLIAQGAVLLGYGAAKDGFDIDEFWTYGLANSYQAPFLNLPEEEWVSGSAFLDYLTVSHAHEYLNVYENQIADVHPPLYYLFMHAICSIFREAGFTKWTGIALNMGCFAATQVLLLALSSLLLAEKEKPIRLTPAALWPSLLYGFSAGAASSVVFIRMYAMMTFWAVALLLALALLWRLGQRPVCMGLLVAVLMGGFLTQYYFLVYACMICACYFVARLAARQGREAACFAGACLLALALGVGFFPWCIRHIFYGYRGEQAIESFLGVKGNNLARWFGILFEILNAQQFGGWLVLLLALAAVCALILIFSRRDGRGLTLDTGAALCGLLASGGYITIIAAISPYKVDRYIFCVYPAVTLALFLLLAQGAQRLGLRRGWACVLSGAILLFSAACVDREAQVHYLFAGDSAYVRQCQAHAELPCVVLGTNDMTQNQLELAAYDRVCLLDKGDWQKVETVLAACPQYDPSQGFILFQRYEDKQIVEDIAAVLGAQQTQLLYNHQYAVYLIR